MSTTPAATDSTTFALRGARSGAVVAGLGIALVVETVALHLWLGTHHPGVAWTLTALSIITLVWMVIEYRASGSAAVSVHPQTLTVTVCRRATATVPRAHIAAATPATWRDIPDVPTSDYLNATALEQPNVILSFAPPVVVRLMGVRNRRVERLGLCLEEPRRFLEEMKRQRGNQP